MRIARLLALAAALAVPAIPQDLPPGILLESQIKRHVEQQLNDLQNYTCLETIHRYHRNSNHRTDAPSHDAVRLEVLYSSRKEFYSAPGERNFTERSPSAYVSSGLSQDGLFGGYLDNIVVGGMALVTYRGEEDLEGRRSTKYDYTISAFNEPLLLNLGPSGSGVVGIKGSFWADPASKNVLRLDIQPTDIPASLPVTSALTTLKYSAVRIGERDIMIPQSADSVMDLASGQWERNLVELTHCRAFEAESSIDFGSADAAPKNSQPQPLMLGADIATASIPAGLRVVVALDSAIDESTPVGTQVEAHVTGAAPPGTAKPGGRQKKEDAAMPDKSTIRGRVRRIERRPGADNLFLLAIELCDVEVNGVRKRFFADLESADRVPGIEAVLTAGSQRPDGPPDLPGVAYFMVRGGSGLPRGFSTVWKTQSLIQ